MPRRFLVAIAAATCAFLPGARAADAAPGPPIRCQSRGPCRQPDTLDVLVGGSKPDIVVAANFGLLYRAPDGKGWQFACEENFGGKLTERMQMDSRGRVLVPSFEGLYFSDDGCRWMRSAGALSSVPVWDVAFDPSDERRVWALAGDPREIYLSTDGAATFTSRRAFPEALRFIRVLVAPSDPRTIYVAGYRSKVPLVLAVSTNGGETWTTDEDASRDFEAGVQTVDLVGVAPDDAKTLYFAGVHARGDQIWKWTPSGGMPVKVLTLDEGTEVRSLVFGATPSTIYVAGRDPLELPNMPPARLYISKDAGKTWENRASPQAGPRYRCLRYVGGKLYACGGDQPNGDAFLLGVSEDEGKIWTPIARMADLKGARSCVASQCIATSVWLCESYRICGPDLPDGSIVQPRDGGADGTVKRGGGGCRLGGNGGGGALWAALGLLLAWRRRRP